MKRIALASVLAAIAMPAMAQNNPGKVTFGLLAEISGGSAVIGPSLQAAAKLAVKEINDRGGLLGKPVELIIADNQSDTTAAVSETKRLVDREKIDVLIGPSLSQLAQASLPVTRDGKVLQVAWASAAITPAMSPYYFAVAADSTAMGTAMVDYVADGMKVKNAAILNDNGATSKEINPVMQARMKERGLALAGEQEYQFRTPDMTPQLLALRRAGPQAILVYGSSFEDTRALVKTLGDIGWKVPLVGGITLASFAAPVAKAIGPAGFEDTAATTYVGFTKCANDALGSSEYAKFLGRLKAFSPNDFDKLPKPAAAFAYSAVMVAAAAVTATGSTSGDKLVPWIEANAGSIKVVTGPLSATKTRHMLHDDKSLVAVARPHEINADDTYKRAGC